MSREWLQLDLQNRRRLFWQLQALGWGLSAVMSGVVAVGGRVGGWDVFGLGIMRAGIGVVLTTWTLRPLLRRFRRRQMPLAPAALVVALVCAPLAWVDTALTQAVAQAVGTDGERAEQFLHTSLYLRWVVFVTWAGSYFVVHYWLDTQDSHLRVARLEAAMRTSELEQLRAQVNPHFLFNAFNSILAEADNPAAVTALTQGVAEYLRFSLRAPAAGQQLGEELDALAHYLRVEQIRFEERLEYAISAGERARRCRVPGALVQPLVENAIKYGQRTSAPPLRVAIEARADNGTLAIAVENTGRWVEPDPARGGGIGLANLRRRLELQFGAAAALEVEREPDRVRVKVRLPADVSE